MGRAVGDPHRGLARLVNDSPRRRATQSIVFSVLLVGACGPLAASQPAVRLSPTPISVPTLDTGQVSRGREVYAQHCAGCHGANAQGAPNWQQPNARGNLPPPPHDDAGHTWRHSDQQLAQIVRDGLRDQFNKTPELTMPPFEQQLDNRAIDDVIAYFKSLWSTEHRQFQEEQNRRTPIPMPSPSQGAGA